MSQVTVTGTSGAGLVVTALVIPNVGKFSVDVEAGLLTVDLIDGVNPQVYDISAATTFTVTISGGNYTIAIS